MDLLIFDMDGVLVDVTESYRATICATVKHFTGVEVTKAQIQDWKNQGGWNDDWRLSQHMIRQEGVEVDLDTVIAHFQKLFHGGNGTGGLILRERWLAREGLFERLAGRFQLAVFTGRLRWEAEFTLRRFAPALTFAPIVGSEDVERLKPFPDGLLKICAGAPGCKAWYVGDTRDDGLSARAAGVPFIGIASPANPRYAELKLSLEETGAAVVLENINQLETVL